MVKKKQKLEACLDLVIKNYMKISTHCCSKKKASSTPYHQMCPECQKAFIIMRGAFIRAWDGRNAKKLPPFERKNIGLTVTNYLDAVKFNLTFELKFESDFTISNEQLSCAAEEFNAKRKKSDAYKRRNTSQTSKFFPRNPPDGMDCPT